MTVVESIAHMRKGARVRAGMRIYYADTRAEVPEGARGTVDEIKCAGALVLVAWDGERTPAWTSFDALEVEKN